MGERCEILVFVISFLSTTYPSIVRLFGEFYLKLQFLTVFLGPFNFVRFRKFTKGKLLRGIFLSQGVVFGGQNMRSLLSRGDKNKAMLEALGRLHAVAQAVSGSRQPQQGAHLGPI